ncbi:UDP-N-acetylmuramoyl-tripeptide--D-alanyl-D-alanine ligase [Bifidobacterium biavatii]|uniref:UDP-N-acetylmuramoyl-tripeptide--D-alanyl-D-alanine ligase n=1 Tax=Bifidobacterium biavatii DSM 23969 TaxID=1437608 RepID=A0A087A553_9BIFI|nr:UDP-N-acetylmuramoyl-tripeptide--D-alanyl-D-alanine ligase [Bifidobacterium biavatii]KFI53903.1 UDP-N-acetylmuramoyl-tripeptide--D-alanyl-D- alanine ligase [Bifidobacterium biavatii DSM 23969]
MMPMTPNEIAEATGGALIHVQPGFDPDRPVATSAVSDSREAGEGSVFVAIAGERVDGHDFLADVAARGAVCALVGHEVDAPITQILVPDTVEALGLLARHNLERRRAEADPFTIVGITGSVGKTTTKDLLKALLGELGPTVAPFGSFNNEIGLPLTALKVGASTRFLVAEMGANHVGEIARLTTIAPPDIAVVLKVGCAHLGEFGSVERIAQAKSEIVRGLVADGTGVLNADDAHVAAMEPLVPGDVLWFGIDPDHAHPGELTARNIGQDATDHPYFDMTDGTETVHVTLGIRGEHNVMNALAAASVARRCGLGLANIARVLGEQTHISAHRMAVSTVTRDGVSFTLIDDSFNANPDSMRAGINALASWGKTAREPQTEQAQAAGPYRIAVLGAMLELGGDEGELHRGIGADAVRAGIDAVIAVSSANDPHLDALAADLVQGARDESAADGSGATVELAHGADEADHLATDLVRNHANALVLLKGSHASGLSALASRWNPTA